MPPILALLVSIGFSIWLIKRDQIPRTPLDLGRWVLLLWLMIRASRPVTAWFGGGFGGSSDLEGNQTEAAITLLFFALAVFVLSKRDFSFGSIPRLNLFLFLLLVYFGVSCLWSAYPFVSFKRWTKEMGAVFVALLLITDPRPVELLKTICIRSAYVLLPLSLILIKYFPHLGRAFSSSGLPMATGVTTQKNSLGMICCIFSLALVWDIFDAKQNRSAKIFSAALLPQLLVLALGLWLLGESQSKTSLIALILGVSIFFGTKLPLIARTPGAFAFLAFLLAGVGMAVVGGSTLIATPLWEAVGRDATLTGRTEIWQAALDQVRNPLIGSGFFIFWNEYGPAVWASFSGGFFVRSVHNGYLETYLDGGIIGCALLGFLLFQTGRLLAQQYSPGSSFSRFVFALFMMLILANFSESYFFRLGSIWFLTVAIALTVHFLPFPPEQEEQL